MNKTEKGKISSILWNLLNLKKKKENWKKILYPQKSRQMVRHVISLWVYEWSQPYMDWCPSTVFCWMVVSHSVFCGSTRFLSEIACCAVKPNNGCEEVFIKIYMIYFHSINLSLVPQEYQGTDRFWMAETVTLLLPWGDWWVCGLNNWCGFCLSKWILGMYRQACHYAFDWQVSIDISFLFFQRIFTLFPSLSLCFFALTNYWSLTRFEKIMFARN